MKSLKSVTQILLLTLITLLPAWQTVHALDADQPPAEQVMSAVNINTASAGEIAGALIGIGESKAEAIVAYREAHGAFSSVDQLMEVKGVGEKILEKNRDRLSLH